MSDAWDEIQAIKSKRNSLRERLEKRKKERQDILGNSSTSSTVLPTSSPSVTSASKTNSETKTELNEIFTTIDNGKMSFRWYAQFVNIKSLLFLLYRARSRNRATTSTNSFG